MAALIGMRAVTCTPQRMQILGVSQAVVEQVALPTSTFYLVDISTPETVARCPPEAAAQPQRPLIRELGGAVVRNTGMTVSDLSWANHVHDI